VTRSDRPAATRLVAVALGLLFAAFATLYGWQAWVHSTPTIFTDELELTQLSRAIAETGRAARRGEPHSFNSLVTYLWAPAWWIDSTKTAYEVIKILDVLVMTSVILPAYLLARSIASRWASVFAAAGAAAIPALSYSPMLLEEPLAYPWAAWSLYLAVRAIATRSRRWIAAAVVVALLGNVVRGELSLLPAMLLLAVGLFAVGSPWGKRRWAAWSTWDRVGAAMLFAGGLIFVNAALSQASQSWEISTRLYKGRIFDLGLQAGTIFTIGVGVLPILAGLAVALSLREGATVERRAFLSVFWAALIAFSTYTAIKAAFLSTNFATRVEERNLFYLAPLLFAAMAAWLDRPRVRLAPALASTAFVGFLLTWKEYQQLYPYFEAPGNGILALSNREFSWTPATQRTVLVGVLVFCAAVLVLPEALRLAGRAVSETWVWAGRGILAALAAVVVAWSLTGEVYSAVGFRQGADQFVTNLPKPLDWVDRATGRGATVYYGQKIPPAPDGVWLTEFWNRSIEKVWSTDGTAPGPGPTVSPDLVKTDGTTWPSPGTDYALADNGVQLVGTTVARRRGLRLYRIDGPLRLAEAASFVDPDGWIGDYAKWADFVGRTPGVAAVTLSRQGFCANAPVGHALVRVSDLVIGHDRHEAPGRLRASRRVMVQNCKAVTVRLPAGRPPFLVDVRITPTFRLSDYGISDSRVVGAVVGFEFEPGSKAAQISVNR
jgi:hypothetical protein